MLDIIKHKWKPTRDDIYHYETVYHDCLVPKEWLQEHEHDLDGYEPSIELLINGKTLSVKGDYKHGVIRKFVKANTECLKTPHA